MNQAINDNDGPALAQAAHALRGAAANIGATTAAALCGELEEMGTNGNHDHPRPLVNRLEAELVHVNIELDRALDGAP